MQIDENTIVYRPDVPDRNALIELYDILNQVNMREKETTCSTQKNKSLS